MTYKSIALEIKSKFHLATVLNYMLFGVCAPNLGALFQLSETRFTWTLPLTLWTGLWTPSHNSPLTTGAVKGDCLLSYDTRDSIAASEWSIAYAVDGL
jgi:hypothetical protein